MSMVRSPSLPFPSPPLPFPSLPFPSAPPSESGRVGRALWCPGLRPLVSDPSILSGRREKISRPKARVISVTYPLTASLHLLQSVTAQFCACDAKDLLDLDPQDRLASIYFRLSQSGTLDLCDAENHVYNGHLQQGLPQAQLFLHTRPAWCQN